MEPILNLLRIKFYAAVTHCFEDTQLPPLNTLEITQSTQEKFGHYQFNGAMKLGKCLKMSPREVAKKIIDNLELEAPQNLPFLYHLEIAGPGFINMRISPQYLAHRMEYILKDSRLGVPLPSQIQRIIVEFSSPNVAKEMHVGHLRSTIIGDCLARLFEFLGHDVLRLNHIGDWGTAFGMLIHFIKVRQPALMRGQIASISQLLMWYKEAKVLFDEDPLFKKASQEEVVALQSGDATALKIWDCITDISRKAYQEIYDLLGVKLTERGESFYNPLLPEIVELMEEKELVTVSDGAKCVFMEGFQNREGKPLPMMIQKSDGGYNYDTTDMAAMYHRVFEEKSNRIIIVTDAGQSLHFKMIRKACDLLGVLEDQGVRFDHVPFGLVLGPDGKKFRTRSGETEKLIDLIQSAVARSGEILRNRSPELNEESCRKLAQKLGLGAIKYADLSCHRLSDYTFSYSRMLRFEGNTAAFLMYSYVRIKSIRRKLFQKLEQVLKRPKIILIHPSEINLALHLARFPETLADLSHELLPNRLCDYLYQLAEIFNVFFRDCRVVGSQEESSRLLLCEISKKIMEKGFHILGLETVEKM